MFHGLADEAGFSRIAPTLEQPATSFSILSDPSKLNRQPQRIHVILVDRALTLEEALLGHQVDRDLWPKIAWMNEMRLSDRLQPGQRIKIVK